MARAEEMPPSLPHAEELSVDAGPPILAGPQRPEHLLRIEHSIHGKRVDLPVVSVLVNGRACWMALDTGASTHLVSEQLIHELGLPIHERAFGKDELGQLVNAAQVEGVTIETPDWVILDRGAVGTAQITGKPQQVGIDGFLSPQLLAPPGESAVLDLKAGLLWTAPDKEAEAHLRGKRLALTPPWGRVCGKSTSLPFRLFVLPAIVQGTAQGLLIDTGATLTNLSVSALKGTNLMRRARGDGTSYVLSGAYPVQHLPSANVRIGQLEATRNLLLVPGKQTGECPYDGVLGLDILSACTLVLNHSQASIGCR
jgi:hypothetical protein